MNLVVEIILMELSEVRNCWWREFLILVDFGQGQKIHFVSYPDWDGIYGNYHFYQFYFN